MTGGKLDTAGLALLAGDKPKPPSRPPLSAMERQAAELAAENARLSAAYNCLRSALAIFAGDPYAKQALGRAELIRTGRV